MSISIGPLDEEIEHAIMRDRTANIRRIRRRRLSWYRRFVILGAILAHGIVALIIYAAS